MKIIFDKNNLVDVTHSCGCVFIELQYDQSRFPPEHWATYWRTCKCCVTYLLTYLQVLGMNTLLYELEHTFGLPGCSYLDSGTS